MNTFMGYTKIPYANLVLRPGEQRQVNYNVDAYYLVITKVKCVLPELGEVKGALVERLDAGYQWSYPAEGAWGLKDNIIVKLDDNDGEYISVNYRIPLHPTRFLYNDSNCIVCVIGKYED